MSRRKQVSRNASSFQDEDRLERLYKTYYHGLLDYASSILHSEEAAEDVIQDLFVYLISAKSRVTPTKSYLFTSVRNRAFDVLKSEKVREKWATEKRKNVSEQDLVDKNVDGAILEKELEVHIEQVLIDMPERRREIFLLARYHGFTYREIAGMLNVSVNVVDKQMGKALAAFRKRLQHFFTTLLIIILSVITFF